MRTDEVKIILHGSPPWTTVRLPRFGSQTMPTNQRLGANRSRLCLPGLFQMSSDERFGLHQPPLDSIFLTRNQQDFRDAAGIQPVHTEKQKMRRHKRGMSFSRSNAKANSLDRSTSLLFRDRCGIGMLTVSDDIGQPECHRADKIRRLLFHHGLGDVLGIRFDRRVQRKRIRQIAGCLPLRDPRRRTDASEDRSKPLFLPARIAIPPQLDNRFIHHRRAASDNRAVNRRRHADKPAHALRQPLFRQ